MSTYRLFPTMMKTAPSWRCCLTPLRFVLVAALALLCCSTGEALAQRRGSVKVPPPENVEINDTADGVMLSATFYPSPEGKESVPVILLHSYRSNRSEYGALAPLLQQKGFAVLVPDLRAHGKSTRVIGSSTQLKPEKLGQMGFARMIADDMEACKRFLMRKHDAEQLNIAKLCLVGSEMGATIAVGFAVQDWSWPPIGGKVQGQDVKALVLLSPSWVFRGLSIGKLLDHPALRSRLAIMIVAGKGKAKNAKDAKRIYKIISAARAAEPPEKKTIFYGEFPTTLQGAKLLAIKNLNLSRIVLTFLDTRVAKKTIPWRNRKKE